MTFTFVAALAALLVQVALLSGGLTVAVLVKVLHTIAHRQHS